MTSTPESVPEPRWVCIVPMSVRFRTCTEAKSHASCRTYNERQRPAPPAASSPDEPQYVGACQVTSTSGVCVLGTAGCITRHIVEAMRSASSPGEASDDRHRNTWDGSCSLCGMGNEYVDQHAPDCPASADEGTPEGCEIDPVSSRGCERGTPGCVTQHADEGTRQQPDTARLREFGDTMDDFGWLGVAGALAEAADWIDAQPAPAPPAPSTPAPQADWPPSAEVITGWLLEDGREGMAHWLYAPEHLAAEDYDGDDPMSEEDVQRFRHFGAETLGKKLHAKLAAARPASSSEPDR